MLRETVIFRATDELAGAIQDRAEEAGLTVSEYLRGIISQEVGVQEVISPVCAGLAQSAFFSGDKAPWLAAKAGLPLRAGLEDADPFDLMRRAADGDTQAQRDFADMTILAALAGHQDLDPFVVLSEGLVLARMADRHGNIDDALRIVTMLALASTIGGGIAARDMAAEAIARLELIADGTSQIAEDAADLLANCAGRERPDTMAMAQIYRDRLTTRENA